MNLTKQQQTALRRAGNRHARGALSTLAHWEGRSRKTTVTVLERLGLVVIQKWDPNHHGDWRFSLTPTGVEEATRLRAAKALKDKDLATT